MKKSVIIVLFGSVCGLIQGPLWMLMNELNLLESRFYTLVKYFSYSLTWFTNIAVLAFFVEFYNRISCFYDVQNQPHKRSEVAQMGLFHGRATRSNYWKRGGKYYLISIVAATCLILISSFLLRQRFYASSAGIIFLLLGLAVIIGGWIIMLPITVRRFHDVDMSGWWVLWFPLLYGVPVLGQVAFVFKLVTVGFLEGTNGTNTYGLSVSDDSTETNRIIGR